MHSKNSQGLHIVYNGEIYNPNEIKNEFIPDVALRTHSDTEILTEVLAVDDPCKVLNAVRGMFAIGSYNSGLESLDLIRDYFGEKPLHYTFGNDYIIFASQFDTVAQSLKTMGYSLEVNQESIYKYLILGYFPFGSSLYNNVYKVHPGSLVRFNLKAGTSFTPEQHYWTSPWKTSAPVDKPINVLENFLSAAVFEQLISDVPVGVFLSGGVDSTLVSALAKKFSKNPIHSFSLGFSEADFDESTYALKASRELGTQHHALQMTSANALEILPEVLRAFPEPLGDPSVFPTTFISREAKKTVTVVLTGDGADELFFG
jgi:asparagine synthase (glutamine-hydrolysing)